MAMQPSSAANSQPSNQAAASDLPQQSNADYVETVRQGAVGAGIFRGQNKHYFVLSRAWKSSQSDKSGYSSGFYPGNAEAIGNVVKQAAERCVELDQGDAPSR
ncbi:MAG: hypothetical protein AAF497_27120 [Planctomycetota bacterium]